jgi:hypothetical protein
VTAVTAGDGSVTTFKSSSGISGDGVMALLSQMKIFDYFLKEKKGFHL